MQWWSIANVNCRDQFWVVWLLSHHHFWPWLTNEVGIQTLIEPVIRMVLQHSFILFMYTQGFSPSFQDTQSLVFQQLQPALQPHWNYKIDVVEETLWMWWDADKGMCTMLPGYCALIAEKDGSSSPSTILVPLHTPLHAQPLEQSFIPNVWIWFADVLYLLWFNTPEAVNFGSLLWVWLQPGRRFLPWICKGQKTSEDVTRLYYIVWPWDCD